MARELRPGVFKAIFEQLAVKSERLGPESLTTLALEIEREAKTNLARSTHRYGERTSARPGGPPALVSGTLRRSVTHSRPRRIATMWEVRVGVASGFYPPYPRRGKRTQSAEYGYYLETARTRNGVAYPFLVPAFHTVVTRSRGARLGRLIAAEWGV